MKILIAKANQSVFLEFDKNIKFKEASMNTCTFSIERGKFLKLKEWVRDLGYNPYALMCW